MKCICCGKFLSYSEMSDGTARFYFEPDNHFGPEISEWTCAVCIANRAPDVTGSMHQSGHLLPTENKGE